MLSKVLPHLNADQRAAWAVLGVLLKHDRITRSSCSAELATAALMLASVASAIDGRASVGERQKIAAMSREIERRFRAEGVPYTVNRSEGPRRGSVAARSRPAVSTGTGFAVTVDGTLLTAAHVVEGASRVEVSQASRAPVTARVVSEDRANDLAILEIGAPTPHYLTLARPRAACVGQSIFTIGFPMVSLLGKEPKFSEGTISSLKGFRDAPSLMQITVPVQPGSSGGPVLTETGEVLGVVTSTAAVASFLSASGSIPQNVNWAVKAEYASALFDQPASRPGCSSKRESIDRALASTFLITASFRRPTGSTWPTGGRRPVR
jgi:S1-C subfamily serine protease